MRTQDSIDAWREVLELNPADFRALAALERLFMQEARWKRPSISWNGVPGARQPERPRQHPHAGGVAVGRQDRRRRIGGGVRARAADRSGPPAGLGPELEQLYRQRKSWVKLVDLLLARTVSPTRRRASASWCRSRRPTSSSSTIRDSAFVTLQAAFREDYSNDHVAKELERLATAADKWNGVDRRIHPGGPGDTPIPGRPPICG